MANATSNSKDIDLSQYNDFELLHHFSELISEDPSSPLKLSAWEIMRRYSCHLSDNLKGQLNTTNITPKWGDAKRVMQIYSIGRTVLDNLRKEGLIVSKSLGKGRVGTRAKRLYNLESIDAYLLSIESD